MFKWLKNLAREAAAEVYAEKADQEKQTGVGTLPTEETSPANLVGATGGNKVETKPKLTKSDLGKAKKLRRKYLDDVEKIINDLPGSARVEGAAIVKMRSGEVKLHTVNDKAQALELVRKARNNELLIIM